MMSSAIHFPSSIPFPFFPMAPLMTSLYSRLLPIVLVIAGTLAYRATNRLDAKPDIQLSRNVPWDISPRYDDPRVVTDEQLADVLERLVPRRDANNTNVWLHALRLWGPHAEFQSDASVPGAELKNFFLDDAVFRSMVGSDEPPLIQINGHDARPRPWQRWDGHKDTSAAHTNDILATMGEIGTPLSQEIVARDGNTAVHQLLTTALENFHLNQLENEWSAISYARYVYPAQEWINRYGQQIRIADVVSQLIDNPLAEGVCSGTHRLEALAVLYRADEQAGALPDRIRRRMLKHMTDVSVVLLKTQHTNGYWSRDWNHSPAVEKNHQNDLAGRILATGHHLEWLALAPPEAQPPREAIVRAGQWTVRALLEVDEETLARHYGPFSHAARALCLWRSKQPYEVWSDSRDEARTKQLLAESAS